MTTSIKNSLIRKVSLGAGALIISSMSLAGAANARNFPLQPGLGGYHDGHETGDFRETGWGGSSCNNYLDGFIMTGKNSWNHGPYTCQEHTL